MYEALLRVAGGGAYERATDGTDTTIELWCNDHCDLLHVSGDGGDRVREEVERTVGVSERMTQGDEQVLVTAECLTARMENNVEGYLAAHGCLLVPPLKYVDGAKLVRALALDADALSAVYRDLTAEFSVTVEAKREIRSVTPDAPLLTVDALLPDLSARQREVFVTAYERGYYELPRETTTAAIADAVGVERRTAEDHLRRAEKKLADSLVEYL
ncbi:helix-turn-helix domain-containing protein [Haloarculaceae archaeon H-GB2-1]|nr:helix-turn-helix domain-containing protein [Haloarculaceae archaeon H-GB1-1]MEA5387674.1 helix-turn-helix domain-containing protein [Haloarculaceae archaeon H-GB11]MEA5409160.1 helix-turn-helix domain-containing protein [Haloarculaceae archaeon H-GB2-1]